MAGGGGGRSAASTSGKRGKFSSPIPMKKARIEIVPLIDVMFFLLAAFMMVSLSLQQSKTRPMELIDAKKATDDFKPDVINIGVEKDGTVAIGRLEPSEDGSKVAYQFSKSGSDWQEIRIRDVASGQELPDRLEWVKFSGISWAKDGSGFYYSRYDVPKPGAALTAVNEFQKIYFHTVGMAQSTDRLVYERKDQAKWGLGASVSDDGHFLLFSVSQGTDTRNRFFYQDLQKAGSPVVELLNDFDASYNFVGNDGPVFWFRTDLSAPVSRRACRRASASIGVGTGSMWRATQSRAARRRTSSTHTPGATATM